MCAQDAAGTPDTFHKVAAANSAPGAAGLQDQLGKGACMQPPMLLQTSEMPTPHLPSSPSNHVQDMQKVCLLEYVLFTACMATAP